MATMESVPAPSRWELAAEMIAVKIRWFGLMIGYALVNIDDRSASQRPILNAILALGALYALLDTIYHLRGRVFLGRFPLGVSAMEAGFIGLLCYFHGGLESAFRYYYLLSLICSAIRHSSRLTLATYALHCGSYTVLYLALPVDERRPLVWVLTLVVLGWVAWTSDALAWLLKRVGDHLAHLNAALRENQSQLEARIVERTQELQETQAHLLHQDKMAALGLLAAGIAHEVGNPLTAISSMVQMLERRQCDDYTREKLSLVSGQLQRIQGTLRELVNFSRPASTERGRVALPDVIEEALSIVKYYRGSKGRQIETHIDPALPLVPGIRDQLVQVLLNLVLNAVDATDRRGRIEITASARQGFAEIAIRDDGIGIAAADAARLFQPYFTTKDHGTGLGLFVCRKLVAEHGGTMHFSALPDRGTEFCVRLPLDDAPRPLPKGA